MHANYCPTAIHAKYMYYPTAKGRKKITFSVNPPLFIAFPQLVDNVQPAELIGVSLEKPT